MDIAAQQIKGADQGADAGAGYDVRENAVLFQNLDDPDMGQALGAAAAQGDADFHFFRLSVHTRPRKFFRFRPQIFLISFSWKPRFCKATTSAG